MICSDYFNKSKEQKIYLNDIDLIEGGSLSGTPAKPIYLHTKTDDLLVGISPHMKDHNKLVTIILSNVKQEVYDNVLLLAKEISQSNRALIAKVKKDKKKPIKN